MLQELGLEEKRTAWARTLSGGQKRRLAVAVAAIGDPRVLYLDEPTSGLDPVSRRQVWALIQRLRRDRVVILTTHFMDEGGLIGRTLECGLPHCIGIILTTRRRYVCIAHHSMAMLTLPQACM